MGSLLRIVFLLILAGKLLLLYLMPSPQLFENHDIAVNFIESGTMYYDLDGHQDFNHQFPLYDSFLVLMYQLVGISPKWIAVFHIIFNALSALLVYKLTHRLLQYAQLNVFWMPTLCALTMLTEPFLLDYQLLKIHPLTFDVFFTIATVYFSLNYVNKPTLKNGTVFCILFGLTLLERATLIVAVVPAIVQLCSAHDGLVHRTKRIGNLVLVGILSFSIFVLPWMLRNHQLTGHFQLTSGTYRYLYVGSLTETNGTNNLIESNGTYYDLLPQEPIMWADRTMDEQMNFYKSEYLKKWRETPGELLFMWGLKLKNFFWFSKTSIYNIGSTSMQWLYWIYVLGRALLICGAVVGIFFMGKKFKGMLLMMLSLALLQSFFYVETRHLMPVLFIVHFFFFLGVYKVMCFLKLPAPN
jgi:hypothetical protein